MDPIVKTNPYALYVYCDGAMDYDSKNTGGIGYEIVFPESVDLDNIRESFGRYQGANIERIELEGIISGVEAVIRVFEKEREKLKNINTIIVVTDRFRLNDNEGTNPFRIKDWRKNKWCNHEGKAIKNSDLLDKLDKKRKKLSEIAYSNVRIEYKSRKLNKVADTLAKNGKKKLITDDRIAVKGLKVGKRKFEGIEVIYKSLKEKDEMLVHIFLKSPVNDQWEILVEICNGINIGRKVKIYSDDKLASKLQRRNEYKVKLKTVYSHHVTIFRSIKKLKNSNNISGF
jgi:ribonuclease HI